MLSQMAIEDIRALEADGKKVSPLDAIMLNEAGLKVETSSLKKGCPMRRVAQIGGHFFSEMTLAQYQAFSSALEMAQISEFTQRATELAILVALRLWFSETGKERSEASAESLGQAVELLAEIGQHATSNAILDVLRWLSRCSLDSLDGTQDSQGSQGSQDSQDSQEQDVFLGIALEGSNALGFPPSEVKSMTTSQLIWAIDQKQQTSRPMVDNAAFVRYTRILEGIRNGEDRA